MARLRAKSVALTGFMDTLVRRLEPHVRILTPADSAQRGCQLSIRIAGGTQRGRAVFDALLSRGIVCDWRTPDIIRVAPVPLYNRFVDVAQFAAALGEILERHA
jgi:kynureninase